MLMVSLTVVAAAGSKTLRGSEACWFNRYGVDKILGGLWTCIDRTASYQFKDADGLSASIGNRKSASFRNIDFNSTIIMATLWPGVLLMSTKLTLVCRVSSARAQ